MTISISMLTHARGFPGQCHFFLETNSVSARSKSQHLGVLPLARVYLTAVVVPS